MQIPVVRNVLEANEKLADQVRRRLSAGKILTLNLISSPGAGKTSLLERTLRDLAGEFRMAVIEGDLQTDNDARRVAATGAQAVQINTEGGCHLNSSMILQALENIQLDLEAVNIKAGKAFLRLKRKFIQMRRPFLERRDLIIQHIPGFWVKAVSLSSILMGQEPMTRNGGWGGGRDRMGERVWGRAPIGRMTWSGGGGMEGVWQNIREAGLEIVKGEGGHTT